MRCFVLLNEGRAGGRGVVMAQASPTRTAARPITARLRQGEAELCSQRRTAFC